MIFFLIAAVITIAYSIHQYVKYYSFSRIWSWFKSEFLLTAFSTCAVALMISCEAEHSSCRVEIFTKTQNCVIMFPMTQIIRNIF